jgi:hypothetical protein
MLLSASLFLLFAWSGNAIAQTSAPAPAQPKSAHPPHTFVPQMNTDDPAPGSTPIPAANAPAPEFNPWRLAYYAEYQGPPLGNFNPLYTQAPGSDPAYTEIYHSLKIGYAVSKYVTIGIQEQADSPFDPAGNFSFEDQRVYVQWNHMVETSDLDLGTKFAADIPTTDHSRQIGKLVTLRVDANFEFKTPLRDWDFSVDLAFRNSFFNDPVSNNGQTDMRVALYPYITYNIIPNLQALFEASFDAAHNYNANFYDYTSGESDYFDLGPLITINSHINTNLALRFFTDDISFNAAVVYANITVAL